MILQVIILTIWLSSAVLSFPKFYYVTTIEHRLTHTDETEIFCVMDVTKFNHKIADIVTFLLLLLLPLLTIALLCAKAALFLREQRRQWTVDSHENMALNSHRTPLEEQESSSRANHRRGGAIRRSAPSRCQRTHVAAILQNRFETESETIEERPPDESQVPGISSRRTSQTDKNDGHPRRNTMILMQIPSSSPSASSPSQLCQKHLRVIKMLMAVASCFALCNLPFYLQKMLRNYFALYKSDNEWLELIPPITFLMMCLNCAINPFLHALFTKRFQQCLVEVVKCDVRRRARVPSSFS